MKRTIRLLSLLMILLGTVSTVLAAPTEPAFQRLWERNDRPVAEGRSNRSWTWGPAPITEAIDEVDTTIINIGHRTVQYFDKGRMELNNPQADPQSPWYVTSGLLPYELMVGRTDYAHSKQWTQSYVAAIGDPNTFPAYPDLLALYQKPGQLAPGKLGKPVTEILNHDMTIGVFSDFVNDPATVLVPGENNHGIPQAFKDFQTQRGKVYEGGRLVDRQIYDPLFIFGLPLTPAVWVKATIGGKVQPVIFQVFERRVLTYQPSNPAAFRVQMGNVGQHYLIWKQNPAQAEEWLPSRGDGMMVTSTVDPNVVYSMEIDWRELPTGRPPEAGYTTYRLARYRIYRSTDGGKTRELRYTAPEEVGQKCPYTGPTIKLLQPGPAVPSADRISLSVQCYDNPSAARGSGANFYTSYDGGLSFRLRIER